MLVVETIAKIGRKHFSRNMGTKTICRELNLAPAPFLFRSFESAALIK